MDSEKLMHDFPRNTQTLEQALQLKTGINYGLTTFHLLTVLLLLASSLAYSGAKWLPIFLLYILCYSVVAFGFHKPIENLVGKIPLNPSVFSPAGKIVNFVMLFVLFAFPILFFIVLKTVPLWHVIMSTDYYGIARFRASLYYDAPRWLSFGVAYYLKGIAPFYLLFLYHTRSKWFYPVFVCTLLFALNMIAKAYVVILLLPLFIYQLGKRQWKGAAKTALIGVFSLAFLVYLTNPQDWSRFWDKHHEEQSQMSATTEPITLPEFFKKAETTARLEVLKPVIGIAETVYIRLFAVPGRVTDEWLSMIPAKRPFLSGCGYRMLAPLLSCDFVSMPSVVYKAVYPQMVRDQNLRGSVTASHFINDYVNFGYPGVLLSALLTALLLASLEGFPRDRRILLALNFVPVLLLTETALPSVLHTGGMFLVNFLYLINRDRMLDIISCGRIGSRVAEDE
ncbi:MAG: hypothetical protein PHY92_01970 [Alphaproteobacteria bacterium]|nr:hypothetical protein [Alphaproteobacteria bacterium]